MSLTVAELRKALKGVKGNTPVYTRDFDHAQYETNGLAVNAEYLNQKNMSRYERENLDECFKIDGGYFVVSA